MPTIRYECTAYPELHVGPLQFREGALVTGDPHEQDILDRSAYAPQFVRIVLEPAHGDGAQAVPTPTPTADDSARAGVSGDEAIVSEGERGSRYDTLAPDRDNGVSTAPKTEPAPAGSGAASPAGKRGRGRRQ